MPASGSAESTHTHCSAGFQRTRRVQPQTHPSSRADPGEGRPRRAAVPPSRETAGSRPDWGGPCSRPGPPGPQPDAPLRRGGQRSPRDHPRDHPTHSRVKAQRWAPGSLFASCPSGPINTGNYISPLLSLGSQKYELFLLALAVSNNSSSPW